jgi:TetR/AcrR family tetracycline transcriptional repressor
MKINRDMITRAGLKLLDQDGLEQLTLRRLAVELDVQAATIYWHFKSKEDLLDEMATTVLAEGAHHLIPQRNSSGWRVWASTFGEGLRQTLLAYRDGARMVGGTRLTNTDSLKTTERIGSRMVESGFSVRAAVVLLGTIYNARPALAALLHRRSQGPPGARDLSLPPPGLIHPLRPLRPPLPGRPQTHPSGRTAG